MRLSPSLTIAVEWPGVAIERRRAAFLCAVVIVFALVAAVDARCGGGDIPSSRRRPSSRAWAAPERRDLLRARRRRRRCRRSVHGVRRERKREKKSETRRTRSFLFERCREWCRRRKKMMKLDLQKSNSLSPPLKITNTHTHKSEIHGCSQSRAHGGALCSSYM